MMDDNERISELTEIFRLLGAAEPESWATYEVERDSPQLAMYLFLMRAAMMCSEKHIEVWLSSIAHQHAAGINEAKRALREIRANGVSNKELTPLLMTFCRNLLSDMCFLLDNTSPHDFGNVKLNNRLKKVNWELFTVDDHGKPLQSMGGLHEIFQEVAGEHLPNAE